MTLQTIAQCSVSDCDTVVECRGLCNKHYIRFRRHGDPLITKRYEAKEMQPLCDYAGTVQGDWRVLSYEGQSLWQCQCIFCDEIQLRHTTAIRRHPVHGHANHPMYGKWCGMMSRCYNPNNKRYEYYGARGITVCARWHDAKYFILDMGMPPSVDYSIDRIDNDADYSPDNCRWATQIEQANNKRTTLKLTYQDETLPLTEWGRRLGLSMHMLRRRYHQGWQPQEILCLPPRTRMTDAAVNGELNSGVLE